MKKKDYIEAIPLLILTIIGIYSIIEVMTTNYILGNRQHIGLTLLGMSMILFLIKRRIYKYVFGITIIMGLVNLVGFTTSITTMNFIGLPIQILMIPFIILYTWINKEELKPKIHYFLGNSHEQMSDKSSSKTNVFRKKFEKLTDKEIKSKLNEGLVPEAIAALKDIKKERESDL